METEQKAKEQGAVQGSSLLTFVLVVAGIALILLSGFWYFLGGFNFSKSSYSETNTVFSTVLEKNAAFAEAERRYHAKDFEGAILKYNEALPHAADAYQEGLIKYRIALATEEMPGESNYLLAIPLLKEVAADSDYSPVTRANAVQELGLIFTRYGDPRITSSIFSTGPYSSFYEPDDVAVSYRRLFEYATTLAPIALSELRVAEWYVNKILEQARSVSAAMDFPLSGLTARAGDPAVWKTLADRTGGNARELESRFVEWKKIIRDRVATADQYVQRIQDNPHESVIIPGAVQRKGVIALRMQSIGDSSFGDPLNLLSQAIRLYAEQGMPEGDGYARYYYAQALLAASDNGARAAVKETLSPLYETDLYKGAAVEHFFRNEKNNVLGVKETVGQLAAADAGFKAYLQKLGWSETDFR